MDKYKPVPIRSESDWVQRALFRDILKDAGKALLDERSLVNCRECYGFGHSRTNCPTRRKLDTLSRLDPIARSGVGKYRYKAAATKDKKTYVIWPALT